MNDEDIDTSDISSVNSTQWSKGRFLMDILTVLVFVNDVNRFTLCEPESFDKMEHSKYTLKDATNIRIDPELLAWFRNQTENYTALIHSVLEQYKDSVESK